MGLTWSTEVLFSESDHKERIQMKRRTLLSLPLLGATFASRTVSAVEAEFVRYTRSAFDQAMAAGEPLLLDFYAPW